MAYSRYIWAARKGATKGFTLLCCCPRWREKYENVPPKKYAFIVYMGRFEYVSTVPHELTACSPCIDKSRPCVVALGGAGRRQATGFCASSAVSAERDEWNCALLRCGNRWSIEWDSGKRQH
jgi:hypothetical protein